MENQLIDIEKALAGDRTESIAELLDRIRHELKLANALRIAEIKLAHEIEDKALYLCIDDAISVVNTY